MEQEVEISYWSNGKTNSIIPRLKNGNAHGLVQFFYSSGIKMFQTHWKNGSLEGLSKKFDDEHGTLSYIETIKKGFIHGIDIIFYYN